MTTLVWFRSDLRLADNPALCAAAAAGTPVVAVYLHAPDEEGPWQPGSASRWWLHHALTQLGQSLATLGTGLCVRASNDSLTGLQRLVRECAATRVVWNRRYEPAVRARDEIIKRTLREQGIETESYAGALLHEPWSIRTRSGAPYQVFTPFWRHCKSLADPAEPLPAPQALRAPARWPASQSIDSLALLPGRDWPSGLAAAWTPGEPEALDRLERFTDEALEDYSSRRDVPGIPGTSGSPRTCISARWVRARSGTRCGARRRRRAETSPGATRNSWRRSAGASSPITCSIIFRTLPSSRCVRNSRVFLGNRAACCCAPGSAARPATPSSTPACASCGAPAGCTTGCA